MSGGQSAEPGLGLDRIGRSAPVGDRGVEIGAVPGALCAAYRVLGLDAASGGDGVFRDLVAACITSRRAISMRCGCLRKPELIRPPAAPWSGAYRSSPNLNSDRRFRPCALLMRGWVQRARCCTT